MEKADNVFKKLIDENYSTQDIAHIGLRLMHFGSFCWIREANEYIKNKETGEKNENKR